MAEPYSTPATARMGTRLDQEFAEPVTLSSTPPARSPLPRTAARWSFNLLAPRARRNADIRPSRDMVQEAERGKSRNLQESNYSHKYPQGIPDPVDGCGLLRLLVDACERADRVDAPGIPEHEAAGPRPAGGTDLLLDVL